MWIQGKIYTFNFLVKSFIFYHNMSLQSTQMIVYGCRIRNVYGRIRRIYNGFTTVYGQIRAVYIPYFFVNLPRSNTPGRKRPLFIVFRPFGSDSITAVFWRAVNDQILVLPAVCGCFSPYTIRQETAVILSLPNGRNTSRSGS